MREGQPGEVLDLADLVLVLVAIDRLLVPLDSVVPRSS